MHFPLGYIIRIIFLPLRIFWSPFIYPLQLVFQKPKVNPQTKSIIAESNYPNQLFLFIPGRDEINLNEPPFTRPETNIEIIPPPSYSSLAPFSLSGWADTINLRITEHKKNYPRAKVYVFGVSIGGAATGIACARSKLDNVKYTVINSFSSLPQLLWNAPAIEITIFLVHTAVVAITLIAFNSHTLNGLMLTGIILGGCSALGIIFSQVYIRLAQSGAWYNWHQFYRCLPNTNNLPSVLAHEIKRPIKPFNNTVSNMLVMIPVALYKITMLATLTLITLIYCGSYIPCNTTHILSHCFVYGLLWLMDTHHHVGNLLAPLNQSLLPSCKVFQTPGDSVIPPSSRLSKYCQHIELYHGAHNRIDYEFIMDSVCPNETRA